MKLTHVVIAAAVSMSIGMNANAADRGKAYVSNQDGGVSVIDLNTLTTTTTIDVKGEGPRGLAVSEDGKLLVVATRDNGSVSVIDTATNEVIKQIPVGQNHEFVRIKGNYAYVSYEPSSKGGPPPAPGCHLRSGGTPWPANAPAASASGPGAASVRRSPGCSVRRRRSRGWCT